jgi:hypothetical protein
LAVASLKAVTASAVRAFWSIEATDHLTSFAISVSIFLLAVFISLSILDDMVEVEEGGLGGRWSVL